MARGVVVGGSAGGGSDEGVGVAASAVGYGGGCGGWSCPSGPYCAWENSGWLSLQLSRRWRLGGGCYPGPSVISLRGGVTSRFVAPARRCGGEVEFGRV